MFIVNTLTEYHGEGMVGVIPKTENNNSLEMIESLLKYQNKLALSNMDFKGGISYDRNLGSIKETT